MKNFFIGWLIFQLVFLGAIVGSVAYRLGTESYDCSIHEKIEPNNWDKLGYISIGIVFPLIIFMSEDSIKDYCKL